MENMMNRVLRGVQVEEYFVITRSTLHKQNNTSSLCYNTTVYEKDNVVWEKSTFSETSAIVNQLEGVAYAQKLLSPNDI